MKSAIVFEAERTTYSIGQLEAEGPMTVAELRDILEEYDDDTLVVLSHDRGYTYGSLTYPDYYEKNKDGEWEQY